MTEIQDPLQYAKFLKGRKRYEECIQVLEHALTALKLTSDEAWEYAEMLAQICLRQAQEFQASGLDLAALNMLKKAKDATRPTDNSKWRKLVEWKILRAKILQYLAEYYQKQDMPQKEVQLWQGVMALLSQVPKELISVKLQHNLELGMAIALTKLGKLDEAEVYATRAVGNLERDLHINKTIPVERNICSSTNPKELNKFKIMMQSLCLAYHHLGNIKLRLGNSVNAVEYLTKANSLAAKFIKEKKLVRIIQEDLNIARFKPSNFKLPPKRPPSNSSRQFQGTFTKFEPTQRSYNSLLNQIRKKKGKFKQNNQQNLLQEIMGSTGRKAKIKKRRKKSTSSQKILPSPQAVFQQNQIIDILTPIQKIQPFMTDQPTAADIINDLEDMIQEEYSIAAPSTPPESRRSEKIIEMGVNTEPFEFFQLDKTIKNLDQLRKIESNAAVTIQKHVRGFLARSMASTMNQNRFEQSQFTMSELLEEDNQTNTFAPTETTRVPHSHSMFSSNTKITKRHIPHNLAPHQMDEVVPYFNLHDEFPTAHDLKVRRRATASDYETLSTPEVNTRKLIRGRVYT